MMNQAITIPTTIGWRSQEHPNYDHYCKRNPEEGIVPEVLHKFSQPNILRKKRKEALNWRAPFMPLLYRLPPAVASIPIFLSGT